MNFDRLRHIETNDIGEHKALLSVQIPEIPNCFYPFAFNWARTMLSLIIDFKQIKMQLSLLVSKKIMTFKN